MPHIDRLASVHPDAQLAIDVTVGPYAIIEAGVTIGEGCAIGARASVKSGTQLGKGNTVCEGAVLGGRPQHLGATANVGKLIIGEANHFRENTTLHRGLELGKDTIVGNGNFFMVAAHVGHDCHVGNDVILANNAMLGGHVIVEDRAFLSGNVAVHQFCRIGTLAMVGGQARVTRDIPPFVMIDGVSSLCVGLNNVGLRRAGFGRDEVAQIKAAFRHVYRSGLAWNEMLSALPKKFPSGPAAKFAAFLSEGQRGIVQLRNKPAAASLKLIPVHEPADASDLRKAG